MPYRSSRPAKAGSASSRVLLALAATFCANRIAAVQLDLPNSGFESGLTGWRASAAPGIGVGLDREHSSEGANAVRLTDESVETSANLTGPRLPAHEGMGYEVRLDANSDKGGVLGVYLRFYDKDGDLLSYSPGRRELNVMIPATGENWRRYSCQGIAPAGTAFVDIWLHTLSKATGSVLVDAVELRSYDPGRPIDRPHGFTLGSSRPGRLDAGPIAVDGVPVDEQPVYQTQATGSFRLSIETPVGDRLRLAAGLLPIGDGTDATEILINGKSVLRLATDRTQAPLPLIGESDTFDVTASSGLLSVEVRGTDGKPSLAWMELRDEQGTPLARFEASRDLPSGERPFPAPAPARLAEIQGWLNEHPSIFGHTADDRAAWDPLRSRYLFKSIVDAAAKLVDAEPPPLSDENFLLASRTGVRTVNDHESARRAGFVDTLVIAEAVENSGRFLPAIERGINAILNERTWVMAAHDISLANFKGEVIEVDLASSARASLLALADQWLGDRLKPETRARIRAEVRRRVLDPYLSFANGNQVPEKGWWWLRGTNNWNAVCNCGVVTAGLILLESREERARLLAIAEQSIPRYFDGYNEDGYCTEGLGYWNFGYSNFAMLAEAVRLATGNRIDFYRLPKARAAALYPGALEMAPGLYPTFADGNTNARPPGWLLDLLEQRLDLGRPDWLNGGEGYIGRNCGVLWLTAFIPHEKAPPVTRPLPASDAFPQSGVFIFRPGHPSELPFTVALKGGHNAEHHNHNDLGSYVVGVGMVTPLLDPGAEVYTTKTFSPQRYDSQILSSYGHAVPVVAGKLQSDGRAFAARVIRYSDDGTTGRVELDLKNGYEVPALSSLRRDFIYDRSGEGRLVVSDTVSYSSPQSFGTALVTMGNWREVSPGKLRVVDGKQGVEVKIESTGAACSLSATQLQGELASKRAATRIGIDLQTPVEAGAITMSIRPLTPEELASEKSEH